ncbi:MAG: glycosyltransferase family 4 protein [Actinomycetia bacterium]|nr:glycosyltransferase family 4 protein [Actinomycetes bacterium]
MQDGHEPPLQIVLFGTFDEATHPRVTVLAEALSAAGHSVIRCNEPLDISTAEKLAAVHRPWKALPLIVRGVKRWIELVHRSRELGRHTPDVVLVGYLGLFDVHLARLCFRAPVILDHMAPAAGTATDRGLPFHRILSLIDRMALRAATLTVLDTSDGRPEEPGTEVVRVGAPWRWFVEPRPEGAPTEPLSVCFFGLFTPLQGTEVIGGAIQLLGDRPDITWTLIGSGQDRPPMEEAIRGIDQVTWIDWVPAEDLPDVVASHDVCLGIFGTTAKGLRVVPNKVFQGAAAGCAVVTSATDNQQTALQGAGVLVPPGDAGALAEAIAELADDRELLAERKGAARARAEAAFSPRALSERMDHLVGSVVARQPRS